MRQTIMIADYGMGNLFSIYKMVKRMNAEVIVSSDFKAVKNADKLILPGVGNFTMAMENLRTLSLLDSLNEHALSKKKPVLGICLGMQLFANKSEEGNATGLGWIDAEVVRFKITNRLKYKVPHIGWNQVIVKKEHILMNLIPSGTAFYFVHSYHYKTIHTEMVLNETEYEYSFSSAIQKENIMGVQYHPEKSHEAGDQLLRNFINL